jgi:hypothetical protein
MVWSKLEKKAGQEKKTSGLGATFSHAAKGGAVQN